MESGSCPHRRRIMQSFGISLAVLTLTIISSCSTESQSQSVPPSNSLVVSSIASQGSNLGGASALEQNDPTEELRRVLPEPGSLNSAELFDHPCGLFALVHPGGETKLLRWDKPSWVGVDPFDLIPSDSELSLEEQWVADVTNDGKPEIILQWINEGANRSFGQVISNDGVDCTWRKISIIDGCGTSFVADNLSLVRSSLQISGFVNCKGGRVSANLLWDSSLKVFIARPLEGNLFCGTLIENIDLPLSSCDEGWAVRMAQQALVDQGYAIDIDGQFGPATQLAVLSHQMTRGIVMSGILDGETWSTLFPADQGAYPDYDGDGISSPREMAHS